MYFKEIIVPNDVNLEVIDTKVKVSGAKGGLEKMFKEIGIKIERTDNKIKVSCESDRRKNKALVGTVLAHIRNMISGVRGGYTYNLRAVYSHFPITVKVDKDKVLIQNFLGERKPRVAKIFGKAEVIVKGQDITVSGIDIDEVSQTAGSIERACRITGYDKKRFQDGIYILGE